MVHELHEEIGEALGICAERLHEAVLAENVEGDDDVRVALGACRGDLAFALERFLVRERVEVILVDVERRHQIGVVDARELVGVELGDGAEACAEQRGLLLELQDVVGLAPGRCEVEVRGDAADGRLAPRAEQVELQVVHLDAAVAEVLRGLRPSCTGREGAAVGAAVAAISFEGAETRSASSSSRHGHDALAGRGRSGRDREAAEAALELLDARAAEFLLLAEREGREGARIVVVVLAETVFTIVLVVVTIAIFSRSSASSGKTNGLGSSPACRMRDSAAVVVAVAAAGTSAGGGTGREGLNLGEGILGALGALKIAGDVDVIAIVIVIILIELLASVEIRMLRKGLTLRREGRMGDVVVVIIIII